MVDVELAEAGEAGGLGHRPRLVLRQAERAQAFERFELLKPSLEGGVPLARLARELGIALSYEELIGGPI